MLVFRNSLKRKELCALATITKQNSKIQHQNTSVSSLKPILNHLFYKSDIKLFRDCNITDATGTGKHGYTALAFVCPNSHANGNEFS